MTTLRADRIFVGAHVATMARDGGSAQALAIYQDRILAVGSAEDVRALAGPGTEVLDLGGAFALPGLIDAHNHMLRTGALLGQLRLYDTRSVGEILERVQHQAERLPAGAWILGRGWDESLLKERRPPTRRELDAVAPHHPVLLHRVWNKLVANSLAFAAAGVDAGTPQPGGDCYAGGWDIGEDGELTGLVRDNAKKRFDACVPPPSQEDLIDTIVHACGAYNAVGITSVADPGLDVEEISAYAAAYASGRLTVRTHMEVGAWGFYPPGPDFRSRIAALAVRGGFGDERLRYDAVKIMADGGIGDRTAAMREPYADGTQSGMIVPAGELKDHVLWCHSRGWPVEVHVCGDETLSQTVAAIVAAKQAMPHIHLRHRVHHAYLPDRETLALMARYDIPAVVQPAFLHGLGEGFLASLGAERAARMIPTRAFLDAGVPLAGSSDSTVADYRPLLGVWSAIRRETAAGTPFDPGEALTRLEALRLYTTGGAYALREEHHRGSLQPGKLADFAVFDRNLLRCPDDDLLQARCLRTVLGGEDVYVAT